jgi:hypothetical protein
MAVVVNEQEYLQSRVDAQINWYDAKSAQAQRAYKRLQVFQIVGAALVPFLAGYTGSSAFIQVVLGFLGVLLAVAGGLLGLYQFQERWLEYRTTTESLKHEKYLFLTRTEPYDGPHPLQFLVQRVESLISRESGSWSKNMRAGKAREATSLDA